MPSGDADAFMMRPTATPSASMSTSSSFHSPDGREADVRLRISEDMTRKWAIWFAIYSPTDWNTLARSNASRVWQRSRTHPTAHARLGQRQSYMLHGYQPNMDHREPSAPKRARPKQRIANLVPPSSRPEKVGCIFGRRRSISAVPDWR